MRSLFEGFRKSAKVHPSGKNEASPSTAEELGCQFTISSTSSSGTNQPKKRLTNSPSNRPNNDQMSQDAEDGPEVLFNERCQHTHAHLYNAARPPMNQDEFDHRFAYRGPEQFSDEGDDLCRQTRKLLRHYYRPCTSPHAFLHFILRFIPILNWLPAYKWRQCLLADAIGGLTVGIMHVPQGIAYALLARLHPVVGLYTSFFPPLFYMLFGTSRHNSIGSFAVVSLMAGMAVEQFSSNDTFFSGGDENKLLMGLLRLEVITTYFSDQLRDLFGLKGMGLPLRSGAGYLFLKLYDTISNIHNSNPITLALSFSSIAFLVVGKEFLNPLLRRRLRLNIPLPFELFIVLIMTIVAQFLHLNSRHGVDIVGKIPTGLPYPILPNLSLVPALIPDALGISAVVIAVHISLAKMFAKKKAYRVDAGQELFALGFCASLSSFFPVYPVSCSLGRTLVNVEAGTKTQFSTLFSSLLLGAIILYMGQWLRTLPMCVLSAVIIVALKGMFKKIADLKMLWPLSKIDFAIWLVSFAATVCWDVTEGLAVSIIFALMTTVFRAQWPRWHFLANLSGTNDFRDSERYQMVCTYPGICIFRFDSPLLFTNVDNFKDSIHKAFLRWNLHHQRSNCSKSFQLMLSIGEELDEEITHQKTSLEEHNADGNNMPLSLQIALASTSPAADHNQPLPSPPPMIVVHRVHDDDDDGTVPEEVNGTKASLNTPRYKKQRQRHHASGDNGSKTLPPPYSEKAAASIFYRHFIIDCSGFTFVDCMGVNALKEIFTEMREEQRVLVYFAAAKAPVRDLFEKCGFFQYVQKHNFYPTIRDAVAIARKRRNASTQHLLDEPTERQYDAMETVLETHPMS
uniref:STAS domain-containing protein n=1 Tax=Globodera pallida TaxID=36090 RepID=A0A183BN78_GLOPA